VNNRIFRYQIKEVNEEIELYKNVEILSVYRVGSEVFFSAHVDDREEKVKMRFKLVSIGAEFVDRHRYKFLGSVVMPNNMVWQVFVESVIPPKDIASDKH
jgi:hypothetical protein